MKIVDLKNIKFKDGKEYEHKKAKMQYSIKPKKVEQIAKVKMKKINYSNKTKAIHKAHKNTISNKLSYKKRNGDAYTPVEIILIVAIVLLAIGIIVAGISIFLNYNVKM
ncbi:MAG: hypothetical protein ACRC28_13170 [Clostridium sp.]|uniref:hypothetical protein n=1 Tax=Clostridium sp. TaxID=1506 RepID=UPI003F3085C5